MAMNMAVRLTHLPSTRGIKMRSEHVILSSLITEHTCSINVTRESLNASSYTFSFVVERSPKLYRKDDRRDISPQQAGRITF